MSASKNLLIEDYVRLRNETLSARISLSFVDEINNELKGSRVGNNWTEIVNTLGINAALALSRVVDDSVGTGSLYNLLKNLTKKRRSWIGWANVREHYDAQTIETIIGTAQDIRSEIETSSVVSNLRTYRNQYLAHIGDAAQNAGASVRKFTYGDIRTAAEQIEAWMNKFASPVAGHFFHYHNPFDSTMRYELSCLKIGLQYQDALHNAFTDLPHNLNDAPEDQWSPSKALTTLAEFFRDQKK